MYTNSYSQTNAEFLLSTFVLIKQKVILIKELNLKQKKNKLSLPNLKLKLENTSLILHTLSDLINLLDFNKPESEEIALLYNTIGHRLSLANIDKDDELYQNVIDILDSFISS